MKRQLKLLLSVLMAAFIFSCTSSVKESVVIKLIPVRNGLAYCYIDPQGKIIIRPQFKEAAVFRNGLALVRTFGSKPMWGYIKDDGTFAIKAIFKEATVFREDVAWVVSENGAPQAINLKGDSLFTLKKARSVRIFRNGLAAFSVSIDSLNVNWGFVDRKGTVVIPPKFVAVCDFSNGKCAVSNVAGEWGYINTDGNISINYQYSQAKDFVNGKAIIKFGKEWGVIDDKGKFVINPQFSEIKEDNDQYIIRQGNQWGWCSRTGNITIKPQFSEAYPFNGYELAPVKIGDKFGFVNQKGKLIIDAQFEQALPFNGETAFVLKGKCGLIDKNAKYITQPKYDAISEDLKAYLLTGSSTYESVTSDYFDKDAIIDRLKMGISENTVERMDFNTPMSLIYRKYKKSEADFTKNASEHKIISAERISNDATLDLFILGTPWSESYNGKLGFSYLLKPRYKHTGFSYRINLTTKGFGKEDTVLKSLETTLKGYTIDMKHSNSDVTILQNKYQLLVCLKQKGMIIVAIYPVTPENLQMVDINYGDGTEPDSTLVNPDSVKTN